jgi:hypothetical protein
MKLYLHIGSPKTGTTSIQVFLAEHSLSLVDQRVYVTQLCYANNHIEFAMLPMNFERASRPGAIRRELQLRGISTEQSFEKWKQKFLKKITEDLAKAQGQGAEKYLVSSEFLFFLDQYEIQKLNDLLRDLYSQMFVLMFVRDQINQVESWYSTKLKNGYGGSLSDFLQGHLHRDGALNWFQLDQNWSKAFGHENVVVKVHESKVDVRASFLSACEILPIPIPERRADDANPAVSKLEAMLLQVARKKFEVAGTYLKDMGAERNLLTLAILGRFPGDRIRLTKDEASKLRETFAAPNEELMKTRGIFLDLDSGVNRASTVDEVLNTKQLNAILELLETTHLTRFRLMQARLGTWTYVALVRVGIRPIARTYKRFVKSRLAKRGTPLPMY